MTIAAGSKGGSWVYDRTTGLLIPKAEYFRMRVLPRLKGRAPNVVRDCLDGMKSMVDGKIYTSKRSYYAAVKRAGCEIVGNMDPKSYVKPVPKVTTADVVPDVQAAIRKARGH